MSVRRNRSYDRMQRERWMLRAMALGVGGLCFLVLLGSFFFDDMGLVRYVTMRQYGGGLIKDIGGLERENAELRREIHRLEHDPVHVEELARQQLGWVRKGETVYQLVEKEPHAGTVEQKPE